MTSCIYTISGSEMMKKISLSIAVFLSVIMMIPSGDGKIPMVTENSGSLEYTLYKGDEYEDEVSFENMRNTTMTGTLEAINVECAYHCPFIILLSEPEMNLAPGESMRIKFRIDSDIMNDIGETDLSIDFTNESGLPISLIEVTINIEHNLPLYGIFCFTGILSITLVAFIVYFFRHKKKE